MKMWWPVHLNWISSPAFGIRMFFSQPLVRNEDAEHPRLPSMKQTLLLQHVMGLWDSLHFKEVADLHQIHREEPPTIAAAIHLFAETGLVVRLCTPWTGGVSHLWAFYRLPWNWLCSFPVSRSPRQRANLWIGSWKTIDVGCKTPILDLTAK